MLAMAVLRGNDTDRIGVPLAEYQKANEHFNAATKRLKNKDMIILDPSPFFLDDSGLWRAEYGGKSMYTDTNHLTSLGSLRLTQLFEHAFDSFDLK